MTDHDIFPSGVEDRVLVPEMDLLAPNYLATDYVRLPDCGRHHYSLADAAVLGALDQWLKGEISDFPVGDSSAAEQDTPLVRVGIAPTQRRIEEMLVREVDAGRLDAEVFERSLSDGRIRAERTYVLFDDLLDCLDRHGLDRGEYLDQMAYDHSEADQSDAEDVARDRAQLRYGHLMTLDDQQSLQSDEQHWKQLAKDRALQIAQLQAQIGGGHTPLPSSLGVREKRTLLAIIAVLCNEAKVDYSAASKTADLLHDTATRMGLELGKTTIKNKLKDVQNALGSRMK